MTHTATPTINPEFAALLVPLTEHEEALLLDSLMREGCRDPLTVWAGHDILLDGHARLRLCQEHAIPFAVREVELPDRRAAREWVWQNQAGRRNLRPAAAAYTRGVLYKSIEKRPGARTDLAGDARKWASEDVARLFGLDESTIRRDARFARDLDLIAAELGEGFKLSVLTGKARLSRQDARTLVGMSRSEKERYLQKIEQGEKPRRKKQAVPVIGPAGLEARHGEQDDAGPIIGVGPLSSNARSALPSPIAGSGPPPDAYRRGPDGRGTTYTSNPAPAVAVPAVGDADEYDPDEDAVRHRVGDTTGDAEDDPVPAEEPVDEEVLGELTDLFHRADHATRLAFLGLPLVRAALDRLHALSA